MPRCLLWWMPSAGTNRRPRTKRIDGQCSGRGEEDLPSTAIILVGPEEDVAVAAAAAAATIALVPRGGPWCRAGRAARAERREVGRGNANSSLLQPQLLSTTKRTSPLPQEMTLRILPGLSCGRATREMRKNVRKRRTQEMAKDTIKRKWQELGLPVVIAVTFPLMNLTRAEAEAQMISWGHHGTLVAPNQ